MSEETLPSRTPDHAPTDEMLRSFVNSVRDYEVLMLDPVGRILSFHPGAEAIKGYDADELVGSHFSRFYPTEAIEANVPRQELDWAIERRRFEGEGWRLRKDGSRFWADVIITALPNERGQLLGFAYVTRDLTERRRAEEELRRNEERFRSLIASVKDYAIFMLDVNGNVATWNFGAQSIKGYLPHEIIGSHFSRFYPPETAATLPAHELEVATLEGRFEDEGWRVRKDGSRFWANVIISAVRDDRGKLMGFSKVTRDLTERRAYEERLRTDEERFRLLIDGVTDYAIVMLDPQGSIVSWNSGAERINGYKAEEVIGRHFSHFFTAEDVAASRPWQQLLQARTRGPAQGEGWRVRKDRTLYWAANTLTALPDPRGLLTGFAMVTQDLTQRRQAESLAETTRNMHEFIAMLSHELRNPLAPIRNAITLMGMKGLNDPTLEAMRQTIDRQSAHLARLLDELLDVNRIARGAMTIEKKAVDVSDIIARAVEASRPMIESRGHRLQVEASDQPFVVVGDEVRLTQAVVNLLNNAAKYTGEGGRITVRTVAGPTDFEIHVADNGKGIEPDQLERVFDLFVQVEPNSPHAAGGLGVGLALVRRIVELHGGNVQAHSDGIGKGSEFVIRMPRAAALLHLVETPDAGAAIPANSLRVLVVDDSRDGADSLQLLLQTLGQDTRVAYDGPSALTIASTFRPHIVILDIAMPEMSGYQVARELANLNLSPMPVLMAVTGWGQEEDREEARAAGFLYHFVKPVSNATIRAAVEEIAASALHERS